MCLLGHVSFDFYSAAKSAYLNSDLEEKLLFSVQVDQLHVSTSVSVSAIKVFDVPED